MNDSSPNAVEVRDLTRRFGKDFLAVDRVTFSVRRAQIYGFLGPNGAGKSTTIRMLTGILSPTSGEGRVAGFDIRREPERVKESIGYMSQRFSLYADLSVAQNLDFYAGIYRVDRRRRRQRIEEITEMAGLRGLEHTLTAELSGGWKQRLALGCAILHEPSVLFLDEPTAGVDPVSRRKFWDVIHSLKSRGVTIFVTTHYMDEAEHCDNLSLIAAGRLIATAKPRELRAQAVSGELLSVTAEPLDRALAALVADARFRNVEVFGCSIHVEAEPGSSQIARACIEAAGSVVSHIETIAPSLEDAFIALVKRQARTERDRFSTGAA